MKDILNKIVDRWLSNATLHWVERALIRLFYVDVFLVVFMNHAHNDEVGRWATVIGGNILSALFGIFTGKGIAQQTPPPPLNPPELPKGQP